MYARFMNLDDESLAAPPAGDVPVVRTSRLNAAPQPIEDGDAPLPPLPDYITDGAPLQQADIIPPKPTEDVPF